MSLDRRHRWEWRVMHIVTGYWFYTDSGTRYMYRKCRVCGKTGQTPVWQP